jgi:hypothetical protein
MIADENNKNYTEKPELTESKGTTIANIINCMKLAILPFRNACCQTDLHRPLNENRLTQIYVEQIEVFVKPIISLGVKNQYSDTFFGTKGIPDFYFHVVEEGKHHKPLLVVESKLLPAPKISREKEYVIGNKNNGGIERFKTEKHGKGLDKCGMIGFVEEETFDYWLQNINTWILNLSVTSDFWQTDESLEAVESKEDFMFLKSIAHRKSQEDIHLHHLWINIANLTAEALNYTAAICRR